MTGFGRSNSLSINTSGGLFGNNASQGQQSAGLFGSAANASQPQSTGGLFGSTSQSQSHTGGLFGAGPTSQPPQSGSLFGGQTTTQQPQSAGLFGNLNKPAPAATTGGLFGSSTAQSSQPQQSGGLFGGTAAPTAQNQPSQSGGLFGGLGQNQAQKPSLFGSTTQQQQQTTAPSLFGNPATQQNQSSAPGLFGSIQQNQPPQQASQFGGMQSQNKPFTLGSHTVTGPNLGMSSAVQTSALESIKGTTRFSELIPEIQNQIIRFDEIIQEKINIANRTREALPEHVSTLASIEPDVVYIENYLSTIELGLDNDSATIAHIKELVKKDAEDASLSFRVIENQNLPQVFHYGNAGLGTSAAKSSPNASLDDDDPTKPADLIGYFNRRTDDLGRTLDLYQRQIREIEAHLRTMEAGTVEKAQQLTGSRSRPQDQRRELVDALKAIEGAILDSAKRVGKVRDEVTKQTLGNVGGALL